MHPSDLEKNLRLFVEEWKATAEAEKKLKEAKAWYEQRKTAWERARDQLKTTVGQNVPEKFFSVDGSLIHVKWTREADQKVDVSVRLVEVETR